MKKTKRMDGVETLAELLERIGDVPLERIRTRPLMGTATEKDVARAREGAKRWMLELVEGVLIEKARSFKEILLAQTLAYSLRNFTDRKGIVLLHNPLRLWPGLVCIPDVSFIAWDNIPGGKLTEETVAPYVPDLAAEILGHNDTRSEIKRKLRDYFIAGTRLVCVVQPKTETAQIDTSPTDVRRVGKTGSLDGGEVLPGFTLSLPALFACTDLERQMPTGGPT